MQIFKARLNQRSAEKALIQRLNLQANTDILYLEVDVMHQEVIETVEEKGHKIFVGATAKFDTTWQIQQLKTDRLDKFGYIYYLSWLTKY